MARPFALAASALVLAALGLAGLDTASRALALGLAQDVIGPARAYSEGDAAMREMLRRSMCQPTRHGQ